jgi:CheY-like chemotaxis protein
MSNYIIYVEDDEEDIELFTKFFPEESTIPFEIFKTGDAFLKTIQSKDPTEYPCLIILDINMPQMDGFKLLDMLQRNPRLKKIPAIMFSTSTNPLDLHITEAFGLPFVAKPKSVAEWRQACAEIAGHCEDRFFAGR